MVTVVVNVMVVVMMVGVMAVVVMVMMMAAMTMVVMVTMMTTIVARMKTMMTTKSITRQRKMKHMQHTHTHIHERRRKCGNDGGEGGKGAGRERGRTEVNPQSLLAAQHTTVDAGVGRRSEGGKLAETFSALYYRAMVCCVASSRPLLVSGPYATALCLRSAPFTIFQPAS